jgi:hypothetical protein
MPDDGLASLKDPTGREVVTQSVRAVLRASALSLTLVVAISGCTSIGLHSADARRQHEFGPPDTLRLCLYLDDGISETSAQALIDEAWREEAPLYGLQVSVTKVTRWPRPAFTMDGIIEALTREPLPPGCVRVFALIVRHVGDILWGLLLLPEVLGAVNDETLTHGYAIVGHASLNQLFSSPTDVIRHEIYHLLGCDEHFRMGRCYEQIARLKQWKRSHQSEFFPAWDITSQRILATREAVNEALSASRVSSASTSR